MLSLLAVSLIKCSVLFTTAGIRKKKKGLSRLSIGWTTTLLVDKGNECMPTVGIIYMYSEMLSSRESTFLTLITQITLWHIRKACSNIPYNNCLGYNATDPEVPPKSLPTAQQKANSLCATPMHVAC